MIQRIRRSDTPVPRWSARSIYVVHTGLIYVDDMYVNCVA